jgi:hypothetical protein
MVSGACSEATPERQKQAFFRTSHIGAFTAGKSPFNVDHLGVTYITHLRKLNYTVELKP